MRFALRLITCAAGAMLSCQPTEPKAAPAPAPSMAPAAPADSAPNANAARYGPHGVAVTPSPENSAPPSKADAKPDALGAVPAPAPSGDEAAAEMRGHPCECGKTCHCGHCSGAVPGCHCHVKRADGKGSE